MMAFNSTHPAIDERLGEHLTAVMMKLEYLAVHAHSRICRTADWALRSLDDLSRPIHFSPKEQDILILLSKGNITHEVGKLLDIAEVTVNHHVKNLKAKLHAEAIGETLAKAVDLGLTKPRSLFTSNTDIDLFPYAPRCPPA